MAILDDLCQAIRDGHPNDTVTLVRQAIESGMDPVVIVEEAMVPTMRSVGEKYRDNELDIPGILLSAKCVQKGFATIKELGGEYSQRECGTIILGTVEGDLHDVGKNLVAMMFRGAGFKVVDLGVDVSDKQFLRAIHENPDVSIVCVSSLLSTALPEMRQIVKVLRKKDPKHHYRIMVGGGAVTPELAAQMGADAYTDNCVDAAEMAKKFLFDKQ